MSRFCEIQSKDLRTRKALQPLCATSKSVLWRPYFYYGRSVRRHSVW